MRVYIDDDEIDEEEEEEEEYENDKDPRHLILTGLSGVGKSQIGKRYQKNNPGCTELIEGDEIDIRPVIYVKLPFPFTQHAFYTKILQGLGTDNLRNDVRVNLVKDRVLHLLKKQKTEMIIFDEMNFILRTKNFDNQTAMEMFKDLTNEHQVCLVCLGTPQIEELHIMEDEYIRRFGRDHIKKFEACDSEFCDLLKKIEETIQPPSYIGLHEMETHYPQLLHAYSQGRIGYLALIIKEAYNILGVFKKDCTDLSDANITADILMKAKFNLFREDDHLIKPAN
ncbi:Bacterial TniB protein [compost metagenome]